VRWRPATPARPTPGLLRVASYSAQAKSGKVDGHAVPDVKQTRSGSLLVDVKNGFAFAAFELAIARLPDMTRATGIAAAGFTRSHHAGVVGHHVEKLAEAGLVALAFANTPKAMTAWGGRRPIYGTNPIAFAVPHRGHPPVVVDMALSQVARGKILTAAQKGEAIPEDWALDESGQPTTDAKAALKGSLQPIGGAKGAALALMVEVLAVALTGARFGFEASSFFDAEGGPPGVGQFLLAIDPAAFGGADVFNDRMATLVAVIEGDGDARLPGARRIALREKAAREGVAVDTKLLEEARAIAGG
jgi:(2R)-3-sulfolactate dehydrogenase (NADP+)